MNSGPNQLEDLRKSVVGLTWVEEWTLYGGLRVRSEPATGPLHGLWQWWD